MKILWSSLCSFNTHFSISKMVPILKLVLLLCALIGGLAVKASPSIIVCNSACRCIPGDSCWPSSQEWTDLNATVGGRLIATVPLATECHDPNFNATACANLQEVWSMPQTQ